MKKNLFILTLLFVLVPPSLSFAKTIQNSLYTYQTIEYGRHLIAQCFRQLTNSNDQATLDQLGDYIGPCLDSSIRTSTSYGFLNQPFRDQAINKINSDLTKNYRNAAFDKKGNEFALLCLGFGVRLAQASTLPLDRSAVYKNLANRIFDTCYLSQAGVRSNEKLAYTYFRSFLKGHPINFVEKFARETYQLGFEYLSKISDVKKNSANSEKSDKQIDLLTKKAKRYFAISARFYARSLLNLEVLPELLGTEHSLSYYFRNSVTRGLNASSNAGGLQKVNRFILAKASESPLLAHSDPLTNKIANQLALEITSDLNYLHGIFLRLLTNQTAMILSLFLLIVFFTAYKNSSEIDKYGFRTSMTKIIEGTHLTWKEKLLIFFAGIIVSTVIATVNESKAKIFADKTQQYQLIGP